MSFVNREFASIVGDESVGNDAVPLQNDDADDTLVLSSSSSVSGDGESSYNEPHGPFYIKYSYMPILSMQDMSIGSRGPKFYCHLCENYFHTRLSMITHMKMHGLPFCPVCFAMFPQASDVNYHMAGYHPEVTQLEDTPALCPEEMPCMEDSFERVEAPPNSPNLVNGFKLDQLGETLDSNNNTMSSLLLDKLREHQLAVDLQGDIGDGQPDQQFQLEPDVEIQKTTTTETTGGARGLRYNDKKSPISGTSGKVHKGSKTKPSPKMIANMKGQTEGGQEEHVLKVTSRFGRSISLKIPQF